MRTTEIPYLTRNWRPVDGCTPVSDGCDHCYALRNARRWKRSFQVTLRPERLEEPLHWRAPQRVGICFHGDLFHEKVPDEFLDKVFAVMALTPQHTYVLLTKRPERMRAHLTDENRVIWWDKVKGEKAPVPTNTATHVLWDAQKLNDSGFYLPNGECLNGIDMAWPLPNVWLGVSVENQEAADERIPLLLETLAAHRCLSVEPLLERVDLHGLGGRYGEPLIQWVVVGGESGPHHRECKVGWIAEVVNQCMEASVPAYVKQDSGPRPGQQGRIPDALWAVKQLPEGWT